MTNKINVDLLVNLFLFIIYTILLFFGSYL